MPYCAFIAIGMLRKRSCVNGCAALFLSCCTVKIIYHTVYFNQSLASVVPDARVIIEEESAVLKYGLDFVNCRGDEEMLLACNYLMIENRGCNGGLRAGVNCPPAQ